MASRASFSPGALVRVGVDDDSDRVERPATHRERGDGWPAVVYVMRGGTVRMCNGKHNSKEDG
ncbi:hypothetical protein FGU65_07350 [Methanoculleus sp. FWC-SCC1]|uniref:Uncharacterized protein n=1 Tax=Methanoculleus frigidifontis TaxID=2584085 RepID=A0ABT8M9T7_9EURY|nr:hypothetical protein [Methanoculleus sp. FWC-SCC1]MDN7024702.1 hypothetical protein [Methanoculleus sp. FWC-SCC1]